MTDTTINSLVVGSAIVTSEIIELGGLSWYIDSKTAIAVGIGIVISLLLQVGVHLHNDELPAMIAKKFFVNLTAASANFIFTVILASQQDWPYIFATGLAIIIGMQGVDFYVNWAQKVKDLGPRLYALLGDVFTRR